MSARITGATLRKSGILCISCMAGCGTNRSSQPLKFRHDLYKGRSIDGCRECEGGIVRASRCIRDALIPRFSRDRPAGVLRERCSLVVHSLSQIKNRPQGLGVVQRCWFLTLNCQQTRSEHSSRRICSTGVNFFAIKKTANPIGLRPSVKSSTPFANG